MEADIAAPQTSAPLAPISSRMPQVGYAIFMDDDEYYRWIEGDFFSALFIALDRLEELDPSLAREDWFRFLEKSADKTLAPHFEKAYRERKKLH